MQLWQVIGAAGLASAWMLWWSLAAAIPVLLHYFYRRRQTTLPWAAMQLLLQVVEREAKRIRLEQLLLLILRTLILLVLAAALARPFWHSPADANNTLGSPPATNWIVAIDTSYSMGYRVDNETRLQTAQRRVVELIEAAHEGDAFALVALGKPPRAVIASPSFDRQAVLTEVGRLSFSDAGCDLARGLQLVADIAERSAQDSALPSQVRVLVLSDLGSDHWQSVVEGPERQLLEQLGKAFPLDIESLADETIANVAVTSLQPAALRTLVNEPLEIDASLRNFGSSKLEQLAVQLVVDGNTVASQRVDVAAGGEQQLRFSHVPASTGQSVVAVSISSDRLPVDNTLRQVIEVRDETQVLFVEQQAGDARLLKLSLHPELARQTLPPRSSVSVFELASVELEKWPVVVLNDLASLDSHNSARLESYVKQGGALLCLLGPRTSAAAWNAQAVGTSLLGFRLLEPSGEQEWGIDPLDYRSPVVAPFAGFPDAGLLTTPIFRYWKIQLGTPPPTAWNVDLATEQGDPLIVRHRLGTGVVVSLLSAPSSAATQGSMWNAMASWPSFVPLMQRLVQTASDAAAANHTVLAGQPLLGRVVLGVQGNRSALPSVMITAPDGSENQIDVDELLPDGSARWSFLQTQQSGVYGVRPSSDGPQQPYAVNVDGSESSLASIQPSQLPRLSPPPLRAIETPESFAQGVESSPWLARWWLLALGILLISESWLAWALGRRAG